jgi:hypothetical protein
MSNDNRNDDLTRRFCEAVERERAKMRDSSLTGIAAMEIKSNSDFIIDTLTPLITQPLLEIIADLKTGSCWCQVGVGNPMTSGQHSLVCLSVQNMIARPPIRSSADAGDIPNQVSCSNCRQYHDWRIPCPSSTETRTS